MLREVTRGSIIVGGLFLLMACASDDDAQSTEGLNFPAQEPLAGAAPPTGMGTAMSMMDQVGTGGAPGEALPEAPMGPSMVGGGGNAALPPMDPGQEPEAPEAPVEEPPVYAPIDCDALQAWDTEWAQFELDVLDIVNQRRSEGANCGGQDMPPVGLLTLNETLTCSSRAHSQDMAVRDFFDHENPDGLSPFDRMEEAGYSFRSAGENIAYGQPDPESVMEGWMDSPGHCQNIMGENFTEIGIGYFFQEDPDSRRGGRGYWTQNFGRPR